MKGIFKQIKQWSNAIQRIRSGDIQKHIDEVNKDVEAEERDPSKKARWEYFISPFTEGVYSQRKNQVDTLATTLGHALKWLIAYDIVSNAVVAPLWALMGSSSGLPVQAVSNNPASLPSVHWEGLQHSLTNAPTWMLGVGGFFGLIVVLSVIAALSMSDTTETATYSHAPSWMETAWIRSTQWAFKPAIALGKWLLKPLKAQIVTKEQLVRLEAFARMLGMAKKNHSELKAIAERRWVKNDYPSMHIENIPEDLKRSMVYHGRLFMDNDQNKVNFATMEKASIGHLAMGTALRDAVMVFPVALISFSCLYLPNVMFNPLKWWGIKDLIASFKQGQWQAMGMPSSAAQAMAQDHVQSIASSVFLSHGWLTAIVMASMVSLMAIRRRLVTIANTHSMMPFATFTDTLESTTLFKNENSIILQNEKEYAAQVKKATQYDKSATWTLGTSQGLLDAQGKNHSPSKGQPIVLSHMDMQTNVFVLGATGAGKTRYVIKPALNCVMASRAQYLADSNPYAPKISLFLMDGKGSLSGELIELAKQHNQSQDVKTIGFAKHEFQVDLLDGLDPSLVATALKSVLRQKGSADGDSFWKDTASLLIEKTARISLAFDLTQGGLDWRLKYLERPYSLSFFNKILLKDETGELLIHCTKAIIHSIENEPWVLQDLPDGLEALMNSIDELHKTWINSNAKSTRDNLKSTLEIVLNSMVNNDKLTPFVKGNGESNRYMKISDIRGSLVAMNLKANEGDAALSVVTFIKTRFMYEALKRQTLIENRQRELERELLSCPDYAHILQESRHEIQDHYQSKLKAAQALMNTSLAAQHEVKKLQGFAPKIAQLLEGYGDDVKRLLERCNELVQAFQQKGIFVSIPKHYSTINECAVTMITYVNKLNAQWNSSEEPSPITDQDQELFNAFLSRLTVMNKDEFMAINQYVEAQYEALQKVLETPFASKDNAYSTLSALVNSQLGHPVLKRKAEVLMEVSDVLNQLHESHAMLNPFHLSEDHKSQLQKIINDQKAIHGHETAHSIDMITFSDMMELKSVYTPFMAVIKNDKILSRLFEEWKGIAGLSHEGIEPLMIRDRLFFVIDEFQEIMTVDVSGAQYTDSGFWNVSRSAGVVGMICTQTISALKDRVGKHDAVENFLNQMRTKIILPSGDKEVMSTFKELMGTFKSEKVKMGGTIQGDVTYRYQSIQHATKVNGKRWMKDPSYVGLPKVTYYNGAIKTSPESLDWMDNANLEENWERWHTAQSVKEQVKHFHGGLNNNNRDTINSQAHQAVTEAENKHMSYLNQNLKDDDVFDPARFSGAVEGTAAVIALRGGKSVMDFVELPK